MGMRLSKFKQRKASSQYDMLVSEAQCKKICSILMLDEVLLSENVHTSEHLDESPVTVAMPEDLTILHRSASDPGTRASAY